MAAAVADRSASSALVGAILLTAEAEGLDSNMAGARKLFAAVRELPAGRHTSEVVDFGTNHPVQARELLTIIATGFGDLTVEAEPGEGRRIVATVTGPANRIQEATALLTVIRAGVMAEALKDGSDETRQRKTSMAWDRALELAAKTFKPGRAAK